MKDVRWLKISAIALGVYIGIILADWLQGTYAGSGPWVE